MPKDNCLAPLWNKRDAGHATLSHHLLFHFGCNEDLPRVDDCVSTQKPAVGSTMHSFEPQRWARESGPNDVILE